MVELWADLQDDRSREGRAPSPPRSSKNDGTAPDGYLHCGPNGAGHFVKMVHNGIEYGMMASIAEGLSIIEHANVGQQSSRRSTLRPSPLREPETDTMYDIDIAEVAEVWRRGFGSRFRGSFDLTVPLLRFVCRNSTTSRGRVPDSGEGRWTVLAAIDEGVPASVITVALYERSQLCGLGNFTDKILSAMRSEFGGHDEKQA